MHLWIHFAIISPLKSFSTCLARNEYAAQSSASKCFYLLYIFLLVFSSLRSASCFLNSNTLRPSASSTSRDAPRGRAYQDPIRLFPANDIMISSPDVRTRKQFLNVAQHALIPLSNTRCPSQKPRTLNELHQSPSWKHYAQNHCSPFRFEYL